MRKYLAGFLGLSSLSVPVVALAAGCTGATTNVGGLCVAAGTGLPETALAAVIGAVLGWMAFVFSSLALIALIYCGFLYLTAGGDDSQAEKAKNCMKWAIVGVVVAVGSFIIIKTIPQFLMGMPPVL